MPFRKDVEIFLKSNHLGVLSYISPEGEAQGAFIYFFVNKEAIFFITRRNSRKFESLHKNHSVALTVSLPEEWTTMQIQGNAERLITETEVQEVMEAMQTNPKIESFYLDANTDGPFQIIDGTAFEAYRVTVTWLRWLKKNTKGKPKYEQIIE